jgi:aromatic ring-cleaving dioxygenase
MRNVADVTGFHARVYFDTATREKAEILREA